MGGHLPIGKEYIYPVVSTCPPSERCTIYPVPTISKARYLRDCERHPLDLVYDFALPFVPLLMITGFDYISV